MDATFTTASGGDPVQSFTLFIETLMPTAEDLQKAGNWLVNKRRTETLGGQDLSGAPFAPYSPAYAFRISSSSVTLYSRNAKGEHMLDALRAQVVDDGMGTPSLEVGIFGNEELATRAKIQNEGGQVRTQLGMGNGGFKTPLGVGRAQKKGKAFATIPERNWLGATDADLTTMQQIIVDSAVSRLQKEQTGNG